MEEPATMSPAPPTSSNRLMFIVFFIALLVITGAIFTLRERLLMEMREESQFQSEARTKLERKLGELSSRVDVLSIEPGSKSDTFATLQKELAELTNRADALSARIDTLEKSSAKPVPASASAATSASAETSATASTIHDAARNALTTAAASGNNFESELTAFAAQHPDRDLTALYAVAAKGIPSEMAMAKELLALLEAQSSGAAEAEGTSMVGKINTHLKGLVRIEKTQANDPYTQLRKDAQREEIGVLIRSIERLNEAERAPLEDWLSRAIKRREALNALATLAKAGE